MGTCLMQVDIARHHAGRDIVPNVRHIARPERTGKTPAHINQPKPGGPLGTVAFMVLSG
jgi:hypothetical protein